MNLSFEERYLSLSFYYWGNLFEKEIMDGQRDYEWKVLGGFTFL